MTTAAIESTESPHCDHLVQVYRRSNELAEAVATFLAAGFEAAEPAVVIVTPAHWQLVSERLAGRGWDTDALEAEELLVVRDAASTLAALADEAGLSATKFDDVVGGLLDGVARSDPSRRIRAFGEMVDILVRRGEQAAADILEGYWNDAARTRNFTLLCGYKIDLFDPGAHATLLPQVHRSHAHILPAADEEHVAAAIERALTDVLGEADASKVYAQVSKTEVDAPASQLALIWISAHMPRAAERVLAAARSHCAVPATA